MVKNKVTLDVTVSMYAGLKKHAKYATVWLIVLIVLLTIASIRGQGLAIGLGLSGIMFGWFLAMFIISKYADDFLKSKARDEQSRS